MKKLLAFIPSALLLFGCGMGEKATQKGVTSAMESLIKSQTGQEIDFADADSYENSKVTASFVINGEEKIVGKTPLVGTVLGTKDASKKMLSFQFNDEEGTMITVIISPLPENFSLPLTAKMYKQNEAPRDVPAATVMFIKASENSMFSLMGFDGTVTVTDLNEKKVAFTVTGKTGDVSDLEKPENWKNMKADFVITSPIIQTMGISKSEILK